jgi:hypothetical protein
LGVLWYERTARKRNERKNKRTILRGKMYKYLLALLVIFGLTGLDNMPMDSASPAPINSQWGTQIELQLSTNNLPFSSPAYGFQSFPAQRVVYFPNIRNPRKFESIFDIDFGGAYDCFASGDFLGDDYIHIYLLEYIYGDLYKANLITGELDYISTMQGASPDEFWTGMTITRDGKAYITSSNYSVGGLDNRSVLYSLNLDTGKNEIIGTAYETPLIIDIAAVEDKIYAEEIINDALYIIDPTTVETTLVGPLGYNSNFAQGMDYDEVNHILYLATMQVWFLDDGSYAIQGQLREANLQTGNTTLINILPDAGEVEAFAISKYKFYFLPLINNIFESDVIQSITSKGEP